MWNTERKIDIIMIKFDLFTKGNIILEVSKIRKYKFYFLL